MGAAAIGMAPILAACGASGGGGGSTPKSDAKSVAEIKKFLVPYDEKNSGKGLKIDLGLQLAFSGSGSYFGRVMATGAKLGAKHIEALGGPTFNLIEKDHKTGDPQAGVQTTRELGLANVPALLSSYTAVLGAILPGVEQYKMMTFDGGGGTSTFAQGKPYFWGTRAITPNDTWPGMFKYVTSKLPKVKSIGSVQWDLGENNQINIDALKKQVEIAGLQMGAVELTAVGATDYSAAIQKVKSKKPDALLLGIFGDDIGVFMKQFATSGLNIPVIAAEYTDSSAKVAGSAYEGLYMAFDYFDAEKPPNGWSEIFINEYRAANKNTFPDYYAANYYEDIFGVWDVVRRVLAAGGDPKSGEQLEKAWETKLEFPSVYGGDATTAGTMQCSPDTHSVTKRPMTISVYKNEKVKPLAYFDIGGIDYKLA